MKEGIIIITVLVVTVALIIGFVWTMGAIGCWQNLSDSGKDYRYKILKGCQYQTREGWLAYDRLRDLAE